MGRLKRALLVLFGVTSVSSFAQKADTTKTELDSTIYKVAFPDAITARVFFINTSNSLVIKDNDFGIDYDLIPNKQDRIGGSVAFRSIVLSYSFAPNFISENQDNEGSKLFNLNLRTFFGQWMQTINFYQQRGFSLDVPQIELSSYFPRIKSLKIGGSTSYILNKNFSYRAIVSQDEKQVKSAGSFIPSLVYYYSKFDIIDEEVDEDFFSYDLAFAPSYIYNWVIGKNLLISAGGSAGIGVNHSETENVSLTTLLTELNFRGSVVYDKNNLYAGAHYSYLVLNHNIDRSSYVKDNIPYLEFFIGYRFNAPKSVLRAADDINDTLGF